MRHLIVDQTQMLGGGSLPEWGHARRDWDRKSVQEVSEPAD